MFEGNVVWERVGVIALSVFMRVFKYWHLVDMLIVIGIITPHSCSMMSFEGKIIGDSILVPSRTGESIPSQGELDGQGGVVTYLLY